MTTSFVALLGDSFGIYGLQNCVIKHQNNKAVRHKNQGCRVTRLSSFWPNKTNQPVSPIMAAAGAIPSPPAIAKTGISVRTSQSDAFGSLWVNVFNVPYPAYFAFLVSFDLSQIWCKGFLGQAFYRFIKCQYRLIAATEAAQRKLAFIGFLAANNGNDRDFAVSG